MNRTFSFLFVFSAVFGVYARRLTPRVDINSHYTRLADEEHGNFWRSEAQKTLREKVTAPLNKNVARNVILFLGDGMSLATLAATRVYMANNQEYIGEEIKLSFEAFPYSGLAKTYCVDNNVADSACSGTAYLTGVKANSGTIGVNGKVKRGSCLGISANSVSGLMDWAQKAGKSTGLVTTTRVTHATPASSYAHSAERKWETDTDLPRHAHECQDIASQMVHGPVGSKIDVVLGGGRQNFLPKTIKDSEGHKGYRSDGINLIEEWYSKQKSFGRNPIYVQNKTELININSKVHNSVLGLFSPDHMPYHLEADPSEDPTLAEMTTKALQMLTSNDEGFFLFVEGGRIDTAHHETKARKALDETAEFAKAVEAALRKVNLQETLVIVTSDHSHTMSYSGYSKRGTDILGFAMTNGSDSMPYTTLSYANGPGYKVTHENHRHDLRNDDLNHLNYTYPALVPTYRETHGGEDVAVFSIGPWAHLFTGNYEQNYLPHAIAYATCIGTGQQACISER